MLLYGQEIPVEVDQSTVKYAELKAGQASLHHIMTVHASGPNTSKLNMYPNGICPTQAVQGGKNTKDFKSGLRLRF